MFNIYDEQEYTVAEAKEILQLSTAQTCRIFKKNSVQKIGKKYSIQGKQLKEIKERLNQTTKTWMVSN